MHAVEVQEAGPPREPPREPRSLLAKVGSALWIVARAVVTRALSWGASGLVLGLFVGGASAADVLFTLDRGAAVLWFFFVVPILTPLAGAALFGMHGLHRGLARAALALEREHGLVRHVVERVLGTLEERLGDSLANVPLDRLEGALRDATTRYLGSDDMREGTGVSGFVLRRAKASVVRRIQKYTLAAFRAEKDEVGQGGGVSVAKVRDRVVRELGANLATIVMSPLNKQLAIFVVAFVLVGVGWFHLVLGVLDLFPSGSGA